MDWLEQELVNALARKEPSAGFDARVRARLHSRPRWLATAATIVVMVGAGSAWREWREWREYRGQQAKEQVMTAMRIAGTKLNRVQMQLKGTEQQ